MRGQTICEKACAIRYFQIIGETDKKK